MTQGALFGDRAPLASRADPVTSHAAAADLTTSGVRAARKAAVLDFLRRQAHPITSFELARGMGIDRHDAAKRLPDLRRDGLVVNGAARACKITGRPALTWRAASVEIQQIAESTTVALSCRCGETFQAPLAEARQMGGAYCLSCSRFVEAST